MSITLTVHDIAIAPILGADVVTESKIRSLAGRNQLDGDDGIERHQEMSSEQTEDRQVVKNRDRSDQNPPSNRGVGEQTA